MKMAQLLWRLACYRPSSYACKPLMMLACYSERIIFGLVMQAFFNALPTQTRLTPGLLLIFLPWLIAIAARLLIVYATTHGIIRFEFAVGSLLQHNLLRRILERPGARGVFGSIGEAISHFRDDTSVVVDLLDGLGDAFALFIYSVVVFAILLHVNAMITLLVFIPLCCILALVRRAQKSLERYRMASRAATSSIAGAIGEIFGAVQAIQVARAEQHIVAHFNLLSDQRRASMLRDRVMSGVLDALSENVIDISKALILVFAALLLSSGQLRPGDLILFITYIGIVTDFFNDLGKLLVQYTQTRISFERLAKFLREVPTLQLVAHYSLPLWGKLPELPRSLQIDSQRLETLEVRDLSYRYPETGRGVAGIDLLIERGTLTVITGRIGAGKTTLLQTTLGLLPKDEGEIRWNGQPIVEPAAFFVPPRSAYTAQAPHLFSDTLKENILLGLSERVVDVASAVHSAVLERDIAAFKHGLETQIGVRGVKLSGGQIQRTAVARMLVRTPELLICDDLSSALD
ncbi:MAG TPA: ABC transporter ATP-binding protein, partial [Ktedonobacteraceae bacterium]|nr:ABC transporter ATP-binding protein [Ktedonobacteraceae bacterium]